jgi:hypothetical protein
MSLCYIRSSLSIIARENDLKKKSIKFEEPIILYIKAWYIAPRSWLCQFLLKFVSSHWKTFMVYESFLSHKGLD